MGKNKDKSDEKSEFSIKNEEDAAKRTVDRVFKDYKVPEDLRKQIEDLKKSREGKSGK